jgi:hypothetical protein
MVIKTTLMDDFQPDYGTPSGYQEIRLNVR